MMTMAILAAVMLNPAVEVKCENPAGWTFDVKTVEVAQGVRIAKIRATSPKASLPPTFRAVVAFPQLDAEYAWNPNFGASENLSHLPGWGNVYNVARTQPLRSWFTAEETNRLTLASSELRREVTSGGGLREEDFCIYPSFTFFAGSREPMSEYETELRLDARAIPFHEAIRDAAAWQASKAGSAPAVPPQAAYAPLYSTWYNFHKDVTADAVEAECAEAAQLGMKVVILDDGWQCDDIERSYRSCGDWRISKRRFPDMRGHVAKIHALGMKYMMWFSMPYVGEATEAYGRLKGKFLRRDEHAKAWILDPRFPECRAYLRDVYLRCLRDWDIDGFKLDFVDQFEMAGEADPAVAENYAGRDCRSIPEGVERLLGEVTAALAAVKPGLLFEFRQAYTGPVIRKYGNMVRVGDCPGSQLKNRVHIANMRLMCDGTSVHSDMLRWNPDETPENAQRFILASLFGTIQYSVMLREAKPEMKAMIAKWIRFAEEHRETLLHGSFRPHFPHLNYPVIEAETEKERIVVFYDPAVKFDLGAVTKPTYVIDGATGTVRTLGAPEPRTASFADFDARAKAGGRLTVVFFGGSLTWSANATEPNVTGFRGLMAKYLAEKYPSALFTFVDAAVGGTGSNLGIFRLERDVLSKKPDLVFLDFSCNDGGDDVKLPSTCCYEYLLREMIGRGIPVEQMFFTFRNWTKPGTVPENVHPRRDVYWKLAKAYGTPVGDVYATGLWKKLNAGEVPVESVWPIDGGHPNDGGYRMFADAGIAGFEQALRDGAVCRVPERPVFGTVRDIRRWNPVDAPLPPGWTRKLTYRTSLWYDGLSSRWMDDVAAFSGSARSPLAVEATGNFFGVFGEADEKALTADIRADGKAIASFNGYHRAGPGRLFIWRNTLLEDWTAGTSRHHAFSVDPMPSGDGKGEFRIGSVCTATLVPYVSASEADSPRADSDALEKLDHARGNNL